MKTMKNSQRKTSTRPIPGFKSYRRNHLVTQVLLGQYHDGMRIELEGKPNTDLSPTGSRVMLDGADKKTIRQAQGILLVIAEVHDTADLGTQLVERCRAGFAGRLQAQGFRAHGA